MSIMRTIFLRMFGRPQGVLGRLGGIIMGRTNAAAGAWASDLLAIGPNDNVVEVGFGPGVLIRHLSNLATAGFVAGVDASPEMVEQARARNAAAIASGRVDLRHGSVENLPFADDTFDKAVAVNSMQVWPDAVAGLREMRRVMKPGAAIALCFTPYSGQPKEGLAEKLDAAGFANSRVVESNHGFCALAIRGEPGARTIGSGQGG
jgi:ubiquinone/menaquinone biosynthesis C-methylase UbiE